MNQLLKIEVNDNEEQTVNGRELYEALEIKTPYKQWFDRMCEYGFKENSDFVTVTQKCAIANGGFQDKTNHALKLDMAKEIAMLQRSEQGQKVRRYFIEVEKEWNSPEKVMQRALIIANKEINVLKLENKMQEQVINELKPKADYTDTILKSSALVTITQIAKDYGMSGQALNKILNDNRIQYKQSSQWLLYSNYQSKGFTHSETIHFKRSDGRTDVKMETKWTQKGRLFLYDFLKGIGIVPVIERGAA